MSRLIYLLTFICFLTACGPSEDQKAMKYLDAARLSLQEGKYSIAKLQIDSIKSQYPKAFDTRKAGIQLMLTVEKEEQLKGLQFIDSVLASRIESLEEIFKKNQFKLDKNEEYQELGTYYTNTQTIEKNNTRAYLRFTTDERGKMVMTSYYYGSFPIKHNVVKIATNSSTFAETMPADNLYESKHLGMVTERQDFILGKEDGDVIDFIVNNASTPLYVTYLGEKTYKYRLSQVDIDAAVQIASLSRVLESIQELKVLKADANKKLKFIDSRIEAYNNQESQVK